MTPYAFTVILALGASASVTNAKVSTVVGTTASVVVLVEFSEVEGGFFVFTIFGGLTSGTITYNQTMDTNNYTKTHFVVAEYYRFHFLYVIIVLLDVVRQNLQFD